MRPVLRKIKVGRKQITALVMPLQKKTLIVIRGRRGYVMCGYLNLKVAEKFGDAAVKITGVANINDALCASVHSCTFAAGKLGIKKGQPVKEVLKILA
jgi:uncharacterized protein YunC (DUF1805 family)